MNILIVAKHSKLEWDSLNLNLSQEETISKYITEKANYNSILNSHRKQINVREMFGNIFPSSEFIMLEDIKSKPIDKKYDLVLVLSGDNGFSLVSHYTKSVPILGVNSDPDRSVGCLMRYIVKNKQDVYNLYNKINSGDFIIEEWSRLQADINGQNITPATSEYFVGEKLRKNISRHILVYRGQEIEQKCSGLIIATGCGSTGWYRSSVGNDCSETEWRPTLKRAAFVATEQYQPMGRYDAANNIFKKIGVQPNIRFGFIEEGEEIKIHSLNDSDGQISIDSWEDHPFKIGSVAKVYLGDPLKVIIPK